jgi:hypothetical protein
LRAALLVTGFCSAGRRQSAYRERRWFRLAVDHESGWRPMADRDGQLESPLWRDPGFTDQSLSFELE